MIQFEVHIDVEGWQVPANVLKTVLASIVLDILFAGSEVFHRVRLMLRYSVCLATKLLITRKSCFNLQFHVNFTHYSHAIPIPSVLNQPGHLLISLIDKLFPSRDSNQNFLYLVFRNNLVPTCVK